MKQHTQPATWLEIIGWVSLGAAFVSAVIILIDTFVRGYRQKMWIMDLVYPISALYWGPVALWFYFRHGRRDAQPVIDAGGEPDPHQRPRWVPASKAISHCGAGCTIGDIAGEWLVYALALTIAGKALYADFAFDFTFAWLLGVVFQYFTIVPMRRLGTLQGIWAAVKADTLSILAFQIGLFFGMWLYQAVIFSPGLPKTTAAYWLMMQLAMILGFFTAWPVNAWLIKAGWKERM